MEGRCLACFKMFSKEQKYDKKRQEPGEIRSHCLNIVDLRLPNLSFENFWNKQMMRYGKLIHGKILGFAGRFQNFQAPETGFDSERQSN